MKKNILFEKFSSIRDLFFFCILFVYQLVFLFQGLDFADEGFHVTFYQQIFAHPELMVVNFMYWFTGIVGGAFYYVFPSTGLLGLRFQGLFVVWSTAVVSYYLLKPYLEKFSLRIGILLLIMLTTNEIKEMHYDTLAALLNVCSVSLIFYGAAKYSPIKLFLGGAMISLSMFTRLPSISLLVLILVIVAEGWIKKQKWSFVAFKAILFISGFIGTTLFIILFMKVIGHWQYYLETIKIILGWGGSSDDSHNISRLVYMFFVDYYQAIKDGVIFLTIAIGLLTINRLTSKLNKALHAIFLSTTKILIFLSLTYLLFSHNIGIERIIHLFAGISLLTALYVFFEERENTNLLVLTFAGCLLILFQPLGSAWGLSTAGRHSLWIIFPILVNQINKIGEIKGNFIFLSKAKVKTTSIVFSKKMMTDARIYFFALAVACCLFFSYYYPYFDYSDRLEMKSTINNKLATGIFTTEERAESINELLNEASKYISKNDYVLAYDCIPMFHFLTETLPYLDNTWPWLYLPEQFEKKLKESSNKYAKLPVVIKQKVNTLGSDWPKNSDMEYKRTPPEIVRDSIFNQFLTEKNYIKKWESSAFEIYLPSGK